MTIGDSALRRAAQKWAITSSNGGHIAAALRLASSDGRLAVVQQELNVNPRILACRNGYLNLDTDEFYPPNPSDLITLAAAADYVPDAAHPLVTNTLNRFVPDEAMQRDLQLAYGYSLTGHAKEHSFIAWGDTKSGKSTILNGMATHWGATPTRWIVVRRRNHDTGGQGARRLGALMDRRMVLGSESNQGTRLNSALLKRVTGGTDKLSIRANYGKQTVTLPVFALWS